MSAEPVAWRYRHPLNPNLWVVVAAPDWPERDPGMEPLYSADALTAMARDLGEARAANERDRTEVCMAVNSLTDAFARRDWLLRGGRGSYEWDDDRFRQEFGDAMAEFAPHVDRLRKIGADRKHCPETQAEVIAARSDTATRERDEALATVSLLRERLEKAGEVT